MKFGTNNDMWHLYITSSLTPFTSSNNWKVTDIIGRRIVKLPGRGYLKIGSVADNWAVWYCSSTSLSEYGTPWRITDINCYDISPMAGGGFMKVGLPNDPISNINSWNIYTTTDNNIPSPTTVWTQLNTTCNIIRPYSEGLMRIGTGSPSINDTIYTTTDTVPTNNTYWTDTGIRCSYISVCPDIGFMKVDSDTNKIHTSGTLTGNNWSETEIEVSLAGASIEAM